MCVSWYQNTTDIKPGKGVWMFLSKPGDLSSLADFDEEESDRGSSTKTENPAPSLLPFAVLTLDGCG